MHREDRAYARAEASTIALANAWREGWHAHQAAGLHAVNPYDGQPPVSEPPC